MSWQATEPIVIRYDLTDEEGWEGRIGYEPSDPAEQEADTIPWYWEVRHVDDDEFGESDYAATAEEAATAANEALERLKQQYAEMEAETE